MNTARLSARWHGHQIGSLVYGKDADDAVKAGVATEVPTAPARKITTGASATKAKRTRKSSPTRETPTEETTSDDDDRTGDPAD